MNIPRDQRMDMKSLIRQIRRYCELQGVQVEYISEVGFQGGNEMPYYVRAFCTDSTTPPLGKVLEAVAAQGISLKLSESESPVDLQSNEWQEVELIYKEANQPLAIECSRDDGSEETLVRSEIQEFIEQIGAPGLSFSKRRVIKHLRNTKYIVTSQLLSDVDQDGYDANSAFLQYFVDHCGGMIQADGEGFYDGNEILLDLH